jgi:PEP-CTERM motif
VFGAKSSSSDEFGSVGLENMKIRVLASLFGATVLSGLASAGASSAATTETFDLTVNGCGFFSSCFAHDVTSLGTVTVTQASGALDFDVSLSNGAKLVGPNALSFSIEGLGVEKVEIGDLTSGFRGETDVDIAVPFGSFRDSVDYTGRGQAPTSFSFVVTDKGDNLTLSDLASNVYRPDILDPSNKENIFLASDVSANRHSGNVGALAGVTSSPTPGVPEPATWSMMLLGAGAVGGSLRLRRKGAAPLAKA